MVLPTRPPSRRVRRPRYASAVSPANRDHHPAGLVAFTEIVLLRFALDNVDEKLPELGVGRARPQHFHDVEFEITAEAWPQFPVASEAELVAALAEMQVRHRTNKTDPLIAAADFVISRGPVCPKGRFGN